MKWFPQDTAWALEYLEEFPEATLEEIRDVINVQHPERQVCIQTVAKKLEDQVITRKVAQRVPFGRNDHVVLADRVNCVQALQKFEELNFHIVFFDESGYNLWTRRRYGRSKKGTRAQLQYSNEKGKNVTLQMVISGEDGLIAWKTLDEATTRENFPVFFQEALKKAADLHPNEPIVGVMDNLAAHKSADYNGRFPPGGHTLIFLSAYSPQLNPCEECFSAVKLKVRGFLGKSLEKIRMAGFLPRGQMAKAKRQVLLSCLEEAKAAITAEKCAAWWAHSKSFYPACLAGLPLGPPSKFSIPVPVPLPPLPLPPEFPELPLLPLEVLAMLPMPIPPYFDPAFVGYSV